MDSQKSRIFINKTIANFNPEFENFVAEMINSPAKKSQNDKTAQSKEVTNNFIDKEPQDRNDLIEKKEAKRNEESSNNIQEGKIVGRYDPVKIGWLRESVENSFGDSFDNFCWDAGNDLSMEVKAGIKYFHDLSIEDFDLKQYETPPVGEEEKRARLIRFYRLGNAYLKGNDIVWQNDNLAFALLKKAEEWDNPLVLRDLGYCYWKGIGCEVNLNLAAQYYTRASSRGHSRSMRELKELIHEMNGSCILF